MTPDSLKQLASPFRRIVMCGSHRSGSLASLLAQPDAKKAIKIYPARDERGDGSFERCTPDASARFPTHNIAFRRSLCLWQREKWSLSHPGPNRPRGHVGDGLGIVLHPPASQSTVRR